MRSFITPIFQNVGIRTHTIKHWFTAVYYTHLDVYKRQALVEYFNGMEQRGKLPHLNYECLAMAFFSSTFGYTFLTASFDNELLPITQEQFINQTVKTFIDGIMHQK